MNNLASFFLSFEGRISRLEWWLGTTIVGVAPFVLALVAMFLVWLINAILGPSMAEPIARLILITIALLPILMLVPWLAIVFKRLQDRDWPWWVGPAFAALLAPAYVGPFLGFWSGTPEAIQVMYVFAALAACVALVVDNGFLRGTKGPNRHGPDPEAHAI